MPWHDPIKHAANKQTMTDDLYVGEVLPEEEDTADQITTPRSQARQQHHVGVRKKAKHSTRVEEERKLIAQYHTITKRIAQVTMRYSTLEMVHDHDVWRVTCTCGGMLQYTLYTAHSTVSRSVIPSSM